MNKWMSVIGVSASVLLLASCAAHAANGRVTASRIARAGVAGTWNMRTLNVADEQVLLTYQIVAAETPSGWTLNLPDRPPMEMRVLDVSGGKIVVEAGPYASLLRTDSRVLVHLVLVLQGVDRLEGILTGIYDTPEGREVVPLRVEGTRAR